MSSIVFAGSAQFIATQHFRSSTPGLIIVLTTFIVNLRHALYSASVAPHIKHLDVKWKGLLAYLLTDEAYAITIMRYNKAFSVPDDLAHRHWYFLGAGLALWLTWQTSTAAGILLGAQIPASWSLDFTLALTFIALVVPALRDRSSVAAALAAGSVAVLAAGWPYKLGLMAAALIGIVMGMWVETRERPAASQERSAAS
jgi:4-azaleucine resistance transporter AzlC